MNNPKTNPGPKGASKAGQKQPQRGRSRSAQKDVDPTLAREALNAFVEAYRNYTKELQQAWQVKDSRQQALQAYQTFMQELQALWTPQDIQKSANEAYNELVKAWQASGTPEEVQRGINEAYNRYLQTLQGTSRSTPQGAAEIYQNYRKRLGDAVIPKEMQEQAGNAYRNFIQAWQRAWAQVAPNSLNLQAFTTINQMGMAAAQMTALAAAALNQQWTASAMMVPDYRPE